MANIQDAIIDFLRNEMLIGPEETPGQDDPLITSGIIDSFSIVALLDHLERTLSIRIARNQLTKTNLDTIRAIVSTCNQGKNSS